MPAVLRPRFCLIVEEEARAGLNLADALDAEGFFVAGPFTSGREALAWSTRFTPDIAVIGPLHNDSACAALVSALQDRGVPVVIHSVDGLAEDLLPFVSATWIEKSCLAADVINIVMRLLC